MMALFEETKAQGFGDSGPLIDKEETEFRKKIEKLTKLYDEISNAGGDTTQIEDEMASAFATAHQSAQTTY